ncbi:MAG: hypothetical protein VKL39_19780 [Leptolyngbyaceae bacterium]|nr:hypothetical protein [Leptolyngbyaceae bacterium]
MEMARFSQRSRVVLISSTLIDLHPALIPLDGKTSSFEIGSIHPSENEIDRLFQSCGMLRGDRSAIDWVIINIASKPTGQ